MFDGLSSIENISFLLVFLVAIQRVETLGDIAAQFEVLFLVFTHRYQISLIQQDVRRHQHRIVKQTSVDVLGITRRFIFKLRHATQSVPAIANGNIEALPGPLFASVPTARVRCLLKRCWQ